MREKRTIGTRVRVGSVLVSTVLVGLIAASCSKVQQAVDASTGASGNGSAVTSSGFPDASNTGVPAGVALDAYNGPCTISTPGTVIDAQQINCDLNINAPTTISRSRINGNVHVADSASISMSDVEVIGGNTDAPVVAYNNITLVRANVHGSRVSVSCGSNCNIQDSWLHGQYLEPGSNWHVNGYLSNGGSNVLLRHNTLACEIADNGHGGGCTGPAASFGDFDPLSNITYDHNVFVAGPGSYCLYGGYDPGKPFGSNPSNIVVTNNVFQRGSNGKCAYYGPFGSFKAINGNVWTGNTWDDGSPLPL